MVTVPIIQDSAQLQTGTGRRRIQASPDAFGAQEARAAGAVAQGLNRVAQVAGEKDDEFNQANAQELANQLERRIQDRFNNAENGYLTTQLGRAAEDGRDQVSADIDGFAAELAGQARSESAQRLFTDAARRRVTSAFGQIAEHAARERRVYLNGESEAAIGLAVDGAAASFADPNAVQAYIDTAIGEVNSIARREGWSPELTQYRVRAIQSDINGRRIQQLAEVDPEEAIAFYESIRPSLSAADAGELRTTLRLAIRQGDDQAIDEAWTFVSEGRRIPAEVWARVPGRARIDIQNEQRRRAEGGSGGGDRALIEDLRIMAVADPDRFARADLRAVRGALGSDYDELAISQARIRQGEEGPDVAQQRTAFNALVDIAGEALAPRGFDLSDDSDEGRAFRSALLRELQTFQAAGGSTPSSEEAQIIIGRAVVGMRHGQAPRDAQVRNTPNRERVGRRNNRGVDVRPTTEVVVPYSAIPPSERLQIGTRLHERLGRQPTRGEVENAYAALLNGRSLRDVLVIGGGE